MSTTVPAPADVTSDRRVIDTAKTVAVVGFAAAVLNILVYGVGSLADAAWAVESGGSESDVPLAAVPVATFLPILLAAIVWRYLGGRFDVVRRFWAPAVIVLGVASLGALTGAVDAATGLALATMHLVVAVVAAFVLPRRLED